MQRYYICPVVGTGTESDPQRPKVVDYSTPSVPFEVSATILTGPDGRAVKPWCLARVRGADLSAIDADPQCVDILERLADAAGEKRGEIINWLKSRTVGSIPAARRNRINARLNNIGVDTTGITLNSTLFDVLLLVFRTHEAFNSLEDL